MLVHERRRRGDVAASAASAERRMRVGAGARTGTAVLPGAGGPKRFVAVSGVIPEQLHGRQMEDCGYVCQVRSARNRQSDCLIQLPLTASAYA